MLLKRVELVGDLHFPDPRNDNLFVRVPVKGVAVEDANFVETMADAGLLRLYTYLDWVCN